MQVAHDADDQLKEAGKRATRSSQALIPQANGLWEIIDRFEIGVISEFGSVSDSRCSEQSSGRGRVGAAAAAATVDAKRRNAS